MQQLVSRVLCAYYKKLFLHGRVAFFQQAICTVRQISRSVASARLNTDAAVVEYTKTIVKLMQTCIGELFASCIFSLGLTDVLFAASKFKARLAIVFIDRMLIYARAVSQ